MKFNINSVSFFYISLKSGYFLRFLSLYLFVALAISTSYLEKLLLELSFHIIIS